MYQTAKGVWYVVFSRYGSEVFFKITVELHMAKKYFRWNHVQQKYTAFYVKSRKGVWVPALRRGGIHNILNAACDRVLFQRTARSLRVNDARFVEKIPSTTRRCSTRRCCISPTRRAEARSSTRRWDTASTRRAPTWSDRNKVKYYCMPSRRSDGTNTTWWQQQQ